jgi:hypothetical protein
MNLISFWFFSRRDEQWTDERWTDRLLDLMMIDREEGDDDDVMSAQTR